jgi:hypothetical protein
LIFETPPKGKETRNELSMKMDEANRFLEDQIEISPSPFKCDEEVAQEGMPNNYMSPSKFLVTRSDYKGN